jgi:hypothetical protein
MIILLKVTFKNRGFGSQEGSSAPLLTQKTSLEVTYR